MYSFGGTKRSAGEAFPNHKQRKTKVLKPGLPSFAQPSRKLNFAKRQFPPTHRQIPPSARKSVAKRLFTAKPSRPLALKKPAEQFRPPILNVQLNGGFGAATFGDSSTKSSAPQSTPSFATAPPPLSNFGSPNRILRQPGVGPSLTGGYGPAKSVAIPSSIPPNAVPSRTGTSLHMPNRSGPTTLVPSTLPQVPRKYPDWVYDEKGGVLRFDGNIIVYHIKGFPLCPWQDLVREGPLDPKWDENKAEIAKAQAEEKLNASEPEEDEDDAYVPPGSSQPIPHRKRSTRRQTKHTKIVNKKAYYDADGGGVTEHDYADTKKRRRVIKIQKNDPNRQPQLNNTPQRKRPKKKKSKWIQCIFCSKWRKIPADVPNSSLGEQWACRDNYWDTTHNSCRDPQELESDTENEAEPPPRPTYGYQGYRREPIAPPVRPRATRGPRGPRFSTFSVNDALNQMQTRDPQYDSARVSFYKSLETFVGSPPPVTTLCSKPIDLYHLYSEVTTRGGYDAVTDNKQWREIFRTMENYNSTHTSASYALKKCYRKVLGDYEKQMHRGY